MTGRPKTSTWGMVLTLPGVVTTISGIVGIAGPAFLVRLCGEGSGRVHTGVVSTQGRLCFRIAL